MHSFSSECYQDFLFIFGFSNLTMICLGVVFFEFILIGVCWAIWICKLMFSIKFEKISAYVSFIFFCYILFLLRLRLHLCLTDFFSNIFSSYFFRLDSFCWSVFRFTDYFFCYLQSVGKPIQRVLVCVLYLLVLEAPFGSFL